MRAEPFFSSLGMELTWLHYRKANEYDWVYGYAGMLRASFLDRGIPFFDIHTDEGALEIATPPFRGMSDIRKYYFELTSEIARFPLVTHRHDTVSGGGHIHVAIPKRIKDDVIFLLVFLTNLFRDITNRPYLNWIFNEWANVKSARSFVHYDNNYGADISTFRPMVFDKDPMIPLDWKSDKVLANFTVRKGFAIKVSERRERKPTTIEFRFFDAKRDFCDIELHVNFVNKYLRYIETITRRGTMVKTIVQGPEDIERLATKDRGLKEFRQLMEKMGLDHANYDRLIETNYRKRKREGLLR